MHDTLRPFERSHSYDQSSSNLPPLAPCPPPERQHRQTTRCCDHTQRAGAVKRGWGVRGERGPEP
eukprot:2194303-Rhodomonas_salina.3